MGNLVEEWFANGKDYDAGVVLFNKLGANKLLMRNFLRNSSVANQRKLEYELGKFLPKVTKTAISTENGTNGTNGNFDTIEKTVQYIEQSFQEATKKQAIYFHQLPPELQPELLAANTYWRENCLLKVQLNELPDEAENEAMKLQLKIAANWKANALCWSKIDYYLEHKTLPKEAESEFEKLSPGELVKRQQYHFQNISKIKSRLNENRVLLGKAEKVTEKARLERLVAKQEADLLKKNEELQTLTRLVDGK